MVAVSLLSKQCRCVCLCCTIHTLHPFCSNESAIQEVKAMKQDNCSEKTGHTFTCNETQLTRRALTMRNHRFFSTLHHHDLHQKRKLLTIFQDILSSQQKYSEQSLLKYNMETNILTTIFTGPTNAVLIQKDCQWKL